MMHAISLRVCDKISAPIIMCFLGYVLRSKEIRKTKIVEAELGYRFVVLKVKHTVNPLQSVKQIRATAFFHQNINNSRVY